MIDTLIDTGPLVAIFNRSDSHHLECASLLRSLQAPFHTTLPVVTEAMYLCERRLGWKAQEALWKMLLRGDLLLHHPSPQELLRMAELMEKYSDHPMDFADASLVALAETLSLKRIFTLDYNDFSAYRMRGNRAFTLIGAHPLP
ncbi:MAG: PIN domain-containing protein [Armatimonadetes bacterium]|nr:PIN domain-containing protein [Armatimonadota bacterium]